MKIDYSRRYFLDENNNPEELCSLLSCMEQQLYFHLKEYKNKCDLFFCDDINIMYTPHSNRIERNSTYTLPFVEKVLSAKNKISTKKMTEIIAQILEKKGAVTISTAFNLLEPYIWYDNNEIDLHVKHFIRLIDYDKNYYYFTESPLLIVKEWERLSEENICIFRIKKDMLLYACRNYCEIYNINVREEKLKDLRNLHDIVVTIIVNFENKNMMGNTLIGKRALQAIKETIITNKGDNIYFLKDHFVCHLVYARHIILKICLEEDPIYVKCKSFNRMARILDIVNEYWLLLRNLILKNVYSPQNTFIKEVIAILVEIEKQEELFIIKLKKLENESKVLNFPTA